MRIRASPNTDRDDIEFIAQGLQLATPKHVLGLHHEVLPGHTPRELAIKNVTMLPALLWPKDRGSDRVDVYGRPLNCSSRLALRLDSSEVPAHNGNNCKDEALERSNLNRRVEQRSRWALQSSHCSSQR